MNVYRQTDGRSQCLCLCVGTVLVFRAGAHAINIKIRQKRESRRAVLFPEVELPNYNLIRRGAFYLTLVTHHSLSTHMHNPGESKGERRTYIVVAFP